MIYRREAVKRIRTVGDLLALVTESDIPDDAEIRLECGRLVTDKVIAAHGIGENADKGKAWLVLAME